MQSVSDSVAKMSKAKFLIALNETDLLMLLLSLSSVKSIFNASSTSSVITLSRLLIKIADQKSCLTDSTLFPVKFSRLSLPLSFAKNVSTPQRKKYNSLNPPV